MIRNRNNKKVKILGMLVSAILLVTVWSEVSLASSIERVKVHLSAEDFDICGMPVLDAESGDDAYEVWEISAAQGFAGNTGTCGKAAGPGRAGEEKGGETAGEKERNEMESEGRYQYEVWLSAQEEQFFSVMEQEDICFSGEKAVCTKAVRRDSGQTLVLTFYLEEPGEITGCIKNAWMEGTTGRWEAAPNTETYLVMLYRNGERTGLPHRTAGLSYDFLPLMQQEGTYYFKVFPLTEKGKKGESTESGQIKLDKSTVLENQDRWLRQVVEMAGTEEIEGGVFTEEDCRVFGWFPKGEKIYYVEKDGCLPQENWICEDGEWYYFDAHGKAKTNCWQEWKGIWYYLGKDGCMEREVKGGDIEKIFHKNNEFVKIR